MNEHETLQDKALLSAAAYTDFFDESGHRLDKNDIQDSLIKEGNFTQQDIEYFTSNFEVVHQQLETSSGFSAAVIKDKHIF
ncbi:hypothetical protein QV08_03300 [Gallibacterium salpingitidis]|uniref:Uncharacterized protein n=1 Tax=Gallibacterium salpingitidis TaxID=505341 RepID=A0AB36E2E8_9PAST|nr:hypothetical protein [Gallibacterium salpingitidis]OBX08840.1 hypothetical protein QV08_03300 [Gallibacterium salpingitidis]OBX10253.1 hypothetical protein QV09_06165 [Gallibacterium salpingitidis]WKT00933.1 hypothetical protein NYR30_06590 [Gallibacterium salpingitidis]